MTIIPRDVLQWTRKERAGADTNLREARVITQGDPQRLDTDFLAVVNAFPYIGKPTEGGRFITDFDEITGYGIRRREGHVIATDGL